MSTETIAGLVPSTELEAINAMLSINGESPVQSLVDPVPAHVDFALQLIRRISRGLQARGWHFNTVRGVTLTRDGSNLIAVPTNTLRLRKTITEAQRSFNISHRQLHLWNNVTNTNTFADTVYSGGIQVDIVYALDFLDLPETARQLIFIMAGRRYQEETFGNPELSGFVEKDEIYGLQNLIEAEGLTDDPNILNNAKDQQRTNSAWDAVALDVQKIGWHFNTLTNVGIVPDGSGYINLPAGTLRAWKHDIYSQAKINAAFRQTRMFDVVNNTYVWSASAFADGKLYVDLIVGLTRAEMPYAATRYIDIKTARQLQPQAQKKGVGQPAGYTEQDEALARKELIEAEGLIEDNNMLVNMSVYRTLYNRFSIYGDGNIQGSGGCPSI